MRFFFASLLVVAVALPASAQQPPDVEGARRTVVAIQELLKQRPSDATLHFFLARFQAAAGDREGAIAAIEKVVELGDGYLPTREAGFATLWDEPRFKAAREKLEARLPRLDFAPTAFELEDRTLIPEGIAHDPKSGAFFVGGIQGKVMRVAPDQSVSEFAGREANLDAVLGLAVDGPRRILYVVSTSALTLAGEKNRRNSVLSFDVDTRRLLRRIEAPAAGQLNDVTVALGGRVFATDSLNGGIYEIPAVGEAREIIPPNQVRGSNGIAASPDGKRLYIAHSTGLAVVDIDAKKIQRVANATRENVAAIDGLYMWQGQLIGVQNLTNPGRVIVVSLGADGNSVVKVQTLLSHHHNALFEPTTGVVTERGFFLLAATGITRFNREGKIDDPATVPKPTVLRIPLPR